MVFMIHTRIVTCLKNVFGTGLILERMTFLTGVPMYPGIITRSPLILLGLIFLEPILYWNSKSKLCIPVSTKAKANGVVDAALADRLRRRSLFSAGN